jgi:hypothetical protein
MTHAKHTTIVAVEDKGDSIWVRSTIGEGEGAYPDTHMIPKLALGVRAAEYDLDPEDPRVLDMILRLPHHPETGKPRIERADGRPPLYYLPTVAEAIDFMDARVEEVRVDRLAPAADTGNRMLADAVTNKAATKGLVQARDHLLKSVDKRLVEPIQYYRDQIRDEVKREVALTPADRLLRSFERDRQRTPVRSPMLPDPRRLPL